MIINIMEINNRKISNNAEKNIENQSNIKGRIFYEKKSTLLHFGFNKPSSGRSQDIMKRR